MRITAGLAQANIVVHNLLFTRLSTSTYLATEHHRNPACHRSLSVIGTKLGSRRDDPQSEYETEKAGRLVAVIYGAFDDVARFYGKGEECPLRCLAWDSGW